MRALIVALSLAACAAPVLAQPATTKAPVATTKKSPATTPARATAAAWQVVPAASSIRVTGAFDDAPIVCSFPRWTGDIRFDPANLAGSSVRVQIDSTAVTCIDPDRWGFAGTLQESGWFDTKRPQAPATNRQVIFQSTSLRTVSPGRYEAVGTVTAKGRSVPVTLPFTLAVAGATADMQGTVVLDRSRFGMAEQSDEIPAAVSVAIRVRATRVP